MVCLAVIAGSDMRRWMLLFACLCFAGTATAQGFDLPGLGSDAEAYRRELTRRSPAGPTPAQRQAAERRAAEAERRGDWAAVAAALEDRVAAADATGAQWLALGRAQLRRTPPEANRALQAGWLAFQAVPSGPPEIPALQLMADALGRLDRPAPRLAALQAVVERAPEDAAARLALAEARRAAGLLLARTAVEPEAEPARACLRFTAPLSRRDDWQPGDWVRAEPAIPGLAVTREAGQLCVAGLPYGQTTRLTLRAGLPGEDGLTLRAATPVAVAMPDRAARIAFDGGRFLLPRGTAPAIPVATVNVGALDLRVVRVVERNLVPLAREWRLGETLPAWAAEELPDSWGRVVWQGRAELPALRPNLLQRAAIPLPDALRGAGPGLYAVIARPADGARAAAAALPVFVTDLGLTAWRGAAGLAVQARGLAEARPLPGATVRLLAVNNEVLAEATTGADGLVRFAAPLLAGSGPVAPRAVHAVLGDDLVALDLDAASFDLTDRGAGGRAPPGPLDAFVWLDRGIYRPGETVQVAALLRDAAGDAAELPARLRLKRPNGTVAAEAVPARLAGAAVHWPVALPASAPAGRWTLEVLADPKAPPIGTAEFRVDAFVPERLEVTAGPAPGPLVPGQTLALPVAARFLYGAPAAGLTGNAELRLVARRTLEAHPGFVFGQVDEAYAPDLIPIPIEALDADGRGAVPLALPRAPDTTWPLSAEVAVAIDEPGGRASRAAASVAVRTGARLIGVRPLFADEAVDADAEAAFEVIALDADGRPAAARLRGRLVRERPDWRIALRGGIARYEVVWRDEPVDAADLAAPGRFARRLPFGRYRFEVGEPGGLALTSVRFRAGWAQSESAEIPDKVDVAADQRAYPDGATARLRVVPPFAGRAAVAVIAGGAVRSVADVDMPAAGAEIAVPIDAAWGPGAHVAVTVFRSGTAAQGPGRALGLAWLQRDPAARRIDVALDAPERARPNTRLEIGLRLDGAAGPAVVTLAAVDEGILRLTGFATPDPLAHAMGRRRLSVDIRDDYGRLIAPTDATAATLRQGGDEGGGEALDIPQRTVALFSGPVAVGADGRATVTLDLPDFAGALRLMAVAWTADRVGAASRTVTVADPLVAEALLPRFLAPGDEAVLPVLLHNLELPAGEVTATLEASGGIALAGEPTLTATLATGGRVTPVTRLRATMAGEGVLRLTATGPGGFTATREARITVRPARAAVTETMIAEIAPGAELRLDPGAARFLPGTWRATAGFGAAVRYDAAGMLRALEAFPFACLEQSAAQLLAFVAMPPEGGAGAVQQAVGHILARQRFDGGFGLWSAQGPADPWATPFAIEALLRAEAAGVTLPEAARDTALRHLVETAEDTDADTPEEAAAQAYRLHVLALGGRALPAAARRLSLRLDALPTPLAKAQLGAALARAGDAPRAEAAFAAALAAPARRYWSFDYGSAARDALAVATLYAESRLATPERLAALRARLPAADFTPAATSTQERAWAVLAAATLSGGRPARVALDGRALPVAPLAAAPLPAPAIARNLGDTPLIAAVTATGVPATPPAAARNGMRIARRFLALDGSALDLDALRRNTVFVLLLEGRAETGEAHRALVQQGLPAGWEIAGRLPSGAVPGMAWLGELSETAAQPGLDDRFAAAVDLTPEQPAFRVAVRVRAATAGVFELPGGQLEDFYRPALFARQNAGRITVRE